MEKKKYPEKGENEGKICTCKEPRVYTELIKGVPTKRNRCEWCLGSLKL